MFFRRRKKDRDPSPADDFVDEDFGYEVDSDEAAERSSRRRRPEPRDESERSDVSRSGADRPKGAGRGRSDAPSGRYGGRGLDDATMVGRTGGDSSPRLAPGDPSTPPPPPPPRGDENLPDATVVLGHAIAPSVASVAWLVFASGPSRGRDFRLPDRITRVGTGADCALRLPSDEYVSTTHAELQRDGAEWLLTDLGSTNGTFRNGERVKEVRLADGDRVRFGLSEFVFKSCRL
ncbi:MAG: FHA domain-containing protein [Gemmatimonadetes bacterium]|nr:FHA domain-containing protein [Gemmatimonadota bacterium]